MSIQTQVTKEELREVFADTLDKGVSRSGILISYKEGEEVRTEIGVPYSLRGNTIFLGPYLKNIITSPPQDFDQRNKVIPISNIIGYKRIELSDLVG